MRRTVVLFGMFALVALTMLPARAATAGPTAGLVYALQDQAGTNQIYGFRLDALTGTLTPLLGFPMGSGGTGVGNAPSERMLYSNGRLYVINDGSDTLSVFAVNRATGALTALPFSPISLGVDSWNGVAAHPNGSLVVVGASASLASFIITDTSATAAAGSPFATGVNTFSSAFSRDGKYVYTGGNGGNSGAAIAGFSVDSTTGVLTALSGSPFDSGADNPIAYATDSAGRLFSANFSAAQVRVFTTAAGVPTGVTGNPFTSGLAGGIHGVLHPAGFYLVADRTGNQVGVYQIAGSDAATTLTAVSGSPFAAGGTFTDALALTQNGGLLVAANGDSRNLTVFSVNRSTGGLSSLGTQAADTVGSTGRITGLALAPMLQNPFDVDGDGMTDVAVYRPSTGVWWARQSSTGFSTFVMYGWGVSTDITVPGDYDGDGVTDIAVYRPSTGTWWVLQSSTGFSTFVTYTWGASTDVPVPGDYDGDGVTDVAVYRPSTGTWWVLRSSTAFSTFVTHTWGVSTDIKVPGDYDGDGVTDIAVYRPSTGAWWVLQSSTGFSTFVTYTWGVSTDIPVAGDYDGDGKTDIVVYRPSTGTWWVRQSSTSFSTFVTYGWGVATDIPIPRR